MAAAFNSSIYFCKSALLRVIFSIKLFINSIKPINIKYILSMNVFIRLYVFVENLCLLF